eukprot:2126769-Rhodomonas_salina.2
MWRMRRVGDDMRGAHKREEQRADRAHNRRCAPDAKSNTFPAVPVQLYQDSRVVRTDCTRSYVATTICLSLLSCYVFATRCPVLASAMLLPGSYAISGTDIAPGSYAMSGTEIGYAATRLCV